MPVLLMFVASPETDPGTPENATFNEAG